MRVISIGGVTPHWVIAHPRPFFVVLPKRSPSEWLSSQDDMSKIYLDSFTQRDFFRWIEFKSLQMHENVFNLEKNFFFWKRRSMGPLASVEKQNGIGDFRKSMKDFRTCTTIESKWSVMWPKTIETIHSILWNEEVEGGKEYDIKNCVCISKV